MRTGRPSRTACQNALFRALETRRPADERVADDTFAVGFLTPEFRVVAELARVPALRRSTEAYIDRRWPCARGGVVARTRLLDDTIADTAPEVEQVLILGAGFDSRPYRLPGLRDKRVFEVDHPDTQALKRKALARRGVTTASTVHLVPVVFGRDDVASHLSAKGFETGKRTLVLWEGTTNYLDDRAVDETFAFVGDAVGSGSPVLFTYVHAGVLDGTVTFAGGPTTMRAVRKVGEPMTFGFDPTAVPAYLAARGFALEWDLAVSELGTRNYWEEPPRLPAYYHVAKAREALSMPKVSEQHLQERRRQIMEAALVSFSRQGFHRTTMQDIVRESGMSAGAFYRYFESKEAIVAALAEEHHRSEAATLARADTAADAVEALASLVQTSLGRLDDDNERRWRRVTVQLWAEALRDPRIMEVVRRGLDGPLDTVAEVIARGQREGSLPRGLDPHATARVCAGIFQGLVVQQAWEPDLDVTAYIESVLGILDGLAAAARAEATTSVR